MARAAAIRRLDRGVPIRVSVEGRRSEGTLREVSDSTLRFTASNAVLTVVVAAVDSLWSVRRLSHQALITGSIAGAAVGGVLGWAIGSGVCTNAISCRVRGVPSTVGGILLGSLLGAGVGWLLDGTDRGWVREWP